jgi:hypothetical protein
MYVEGDAAVPMPATRSPAGAAEDSAAAQSGASTPTSVAEEPATTGTNNQEAGVDEIDRFKTDGRRVVMADDGGRLLAIDISGPTPRKLGQVDLGVSGAQLFLDGDAVIAVGTPNDPNGVGGTWREQTAIARVALGDGAPAVTARATVDGHLVSGRMSGGSIRLVLATSGPASLGFVSPNGGDPASLRLAIDTNRRVIDQSTIADWLPRWTPPGGGERQLLGCDSTYHPATWSGASVLTVATLSPDLASLAPVGVIGGGDTVYASATGLYVATQVQPSVQWGDDGQPVEPDTLPAEQTAIHRFDISAAGAAAAYQGSGTVPGHVLNQYAMSERNGDLRVATTVDGRRFGRPVPMPMPADCPNCAVSSDGSSASTDAAATTPVPDRTPSANRSLLTVLRLGGGELVQVGQLDGLGPNEQIQAVRYVDDRAYVVTFRQTDPLFVLDLADPTAPKVLGELQEPGFSAYLHPVGDHRMLGIGSSGTGDGRITGAKVALYDTSDPTRPRAVATIPIRDGYTDTGGDPHAFTWDAQHHLAFVPMSLQPDVSSTRSWSQPVAGVAVYRVADDGIAWVGWIDHADHATSPDGGIVPCPPGAACAMPSNAVPYAAPVDRTAVVGDRVLAASAAGVSQVAIDGFAETGWVGWD